MLTSTVGQVEVIGLCRVFSSQGINLLDTGNYTSLFTVIPYSQKIFTDISLKDYPGHLEVAETSFFGFE